MSQKKPDDQYPQQEAQARFEAALRGSRAAGHVAMKSMAPKAESAQPKRGRPKKAPDASK